MQKRTFFKVITALLLVAVMAAGLVGCNSDNSGNTGNSGNSGNAQKNTGTINVVWYPNESANTHDDVRAEVAKLIKQATGREVKNVTTTM
jgi:phosphonate transport system substrate-binding protein